MPRMLLAMIALGLAPSLLRADAFDHYTLPVLQKVPEFDGAKQVTELTAETIVPHTQVLPGLEAAMVVVYTNDNRWAKLLVVAAKHKHVVMPGAPAEFLPMLRIERFVTFREGSERAILQAGQGVSLFPGFRFHLDMGQVVPAQLGGDLEVTEPTPKQFAVKPLGKAKMYLLTKPMPEAAAQGTERLQIGDRFEPKYFNGAYKLFDDGRRSGVLRLKVSEDLDVTGTFVSDQNGREYEVRGSISKPNYKIQFLVTLPQTQQEFTGFMFTGDGKAMAGTSKLQEREAGFYALREGK